MTEAKETEWGRRWRRRRIREMKKQKQMRDDRMMGKDRSVEGGSMGKNKLSAGDEEVLEIRLRKRKEERK